jgi:hypothetical protein
VGRGEGAGRLKSAEAKKNCLCVYIFGAELFGARIGVTARSSLGRGVLFAIGRCGISAAQTGAYNNQAIGDSTALLLD